MSWSASAKIINISFALTARLTQHAAICISIIYPLTEIYIKPKFPKRGEPSYNVPECEYMKIRCSCSRLMFLSTLSEGGMKTDKFRQGTRIYKYICMTPTCSSSMSCSKRKQFVLPRCRATYNRGSVRIL